MTDASEIAVHDAELIARLDDLGVWSPIDPPRSFVDAVLARTEDAAQLELAAAPATHEDPRTRRHLPRVVAVAGTAAAIAAALLLAPRIATPPITGSMRADERETVHVGDRAVIVAEPHTDLAWTIDDDDRTRVRQVRGSAFYRVDHGDAFEVVTPAGTVQVTGTCFTVEVDTMGSKLKAGALAAGVLGGVAAVMVTVHEGDVVLANDRGRVAVDAGQSAYARHGALPTIGDVDDPAPALAIATDADANERIAALTAKLREQTRETERLRAAAEAGTEAELPAKTFGPGGPPKPDGFDWFEPTQAALEEMAKCGVVAWDQPPVWGNEPGFDADWIDAVDMSADERAALQSTYDEFRENTSARLREIYVELGGDATAADSFDDRELLELMYSRMTQADIKSSREAIARERAGQAEPPSGEPTSAGDAFMRWEATLGEQFETALGKRLGSDRAHELRAAGGGWSSHRLTYTDLCVEH